jgi:heptosyltransferase II
MDENIIELPLSPKILILALPGVGDTLLATPAIAALRNAHKDAKIHVLVMFNASKEILRGNLHINSVKYFPMIEKGALNSLLFLRSLRKERYDVSLLVYPGNRREYNIVQRIIGAPIRLGHRYNHEHDFVMPWLNTHCIYEDDNLHNVEEDLRLTELLGAESVMEYKPKVYLTDNERLRAREWIGKNVKSTNNYIGFHLGTAEFKNQAMRRWSVENFAETGKVLRDELDAAILIFGGKEEDGLKARCKELIGRGSYIIDSPNIRSAAAQIAECSLFISNDSALMHLASALDVPTVAIFGPTNPVWVKPYRCRHIIVRRDDLDCMPCFYYSVRPLSCKKFSDFRCIKGLTPDKVIKAAKTLFAGKI